MLRVDANAHRGVWQRSRLTALEILNVRTIIALALAAASMALAACNTIEGAGKDVSSAGHAVSDTARDAK